LTATLGIELLARRPDLQAARWRVEASLERIEATEAAFYPDINLSGFIGTDTVSLDELLKHASRTLSIGPALSLPLFDSGRLKASLSAARSRRNEMIADYNQTVFKAVSDVAQEGASLQGLQNQIAEQQATAGATPGIASRRGIDQGSGRRLPGADRQHRRSARKVTGKTELTL
jgi:multidrug efflux system outer membrane protein